MKPEFSRRESQSGQTILEYILLLSIAAAMTLALGNGFKKARNFLWARMACEVSAPCPKCPPDPEVKAKANALAPGACTN
jgi:hypothetical protein